MRRGAIIGPIAAAALALAASGCGGAPADPLAAVAGGMDGDGALIASAQKISDAIGGCLKPADQQVESKVMNLEKVAIVMVGCSQGAYSYTHRLFAVHGGEAPELLSLPDYDAGGWFGSDQASVAELDAGTGVLTTQRKGAGSGACGSEARYQWDGAHFELQELRWQDCGAPVPSGTPFQTIWPAQLNTVLDPADTQPAP